MLLEREVKKIKNYLIELSSQSAGVPEFFELVKKYPDILIYLDIDSIEELEKHVSEIWYDEFNDLRKEVSEYLQKKFQTLQKENEELLRTSNELSVDVDQLTDAFKRAKEVKLDKKIWSKLQNTDSNKIKRGEMKKAIQIATDYNKTDPKILKSKLTAGTYDRPLVLNLNGDYYLVAGNTRLSVAAAMGIRPMIYLASL